MLAKLLDDNGADLGCLQGAQERGLARSSARAVCQQHCGQWCSTWVVMGSFVSEGVDSGLKGRENAATALLPEGAAFDGRRFRMYLELCTLLCVQRRLASGAFSPLGCIAVPWSISPALAAGLILATLTERGGGPLIH